MSFEALGGGALRPSRRSAYLFRDRIVVEPGSAPGPCSWSRRRSACVPSSTFVAEVERIVEPGSVSAQVEFQVLGLSCRLNMSSETLEFEEPLAPLLKEIERARPTPHDRCSQSADQRCSAASSEAARAELSMRRSHRGSACARGAPPGSPESRGLHHAVVQRICRDSRRPAVCRRSGDHDRHCRLQGPARCFSSGTSRDATRREDLSELRLRAPGGLPQSAPGHAVGREVSQTGRRIRGHTGGVSGIESEEQGSVRGDCREAAYARWPSSTRQSSSSSAAKAAAVGRWASLSAHRCGDHGSLRPIAYHPRGCATILWRGASKKVRSRQKR